ncbi:MAG: hypothetical protein SVU32_00395 [Candidatus Nanohaloarchaea archaeon]|nr:hypothetical protein [Candidatus Nanohaloarchaea archaeon]
MQEVATISLGKVRGASRRNKASKAVNEVRRQVAKRTDKEIRVSNGLNEELWANGAGNPPHSIDVRLVEMEDYVLVRAADAQVEETAVDEDELEEEEESPEEAAEEREERDFGAIPEDVRETLKEGTIDEGKEAARELNKSDFELLLNFEEQHQNRTGMKKFLRSNMN